MLNAISPLNEMLGCDVFSIIEGVGEEREKVKQRERRKTHLFVIALMVIITQLESLVKWEYFAFDGQRPGWRGRKQKKIIK